VAIPTATTGVGAEAATRDRISPDKVLMAAVIIATSLTSVAVTAGPAAAKTFKPTGTASCAVGGNLVFDPPLMHGNGTVNASKEVISINLTLSGCSGSSGP
jgi:hypothetical protein